MSQNLFKRIESGETTYTDNRLVVFGGVLLLLLGFGLGVILL